jgi:hypothetical protein
MRKATKTVATWFGLTAGLAGMEHGIFEIFQGNTRPEGVVIASIGPPCVAEEVWNACEPAMTIIPNFLISGILATLLGALVVVWSLAFLGRKRGGLILIVLSVALLFFGGGFFPPLIGLVGGATGLRIHKPLPKRDPGVLLRTVARLWPWPLVAFLVWVYAQWPVGEFFNDFMQQIMIYGVMLILIALPLSAYCAHAYDLQTPPTRD